MRMRGLTILNFGLILICIMLTGIIFFWAGSEIQTRIIVVFFILIVCIISITIIFIIIIRRNEVFEIDPEPNKLEFIESFTGGIAHDFNNCLSAIIGNISFAKTCINVGDELFEILDDAEKSSIQALDLIKQFSVFSKSGPSVIELKKIQSIIKDAANTILKGSKVTCRYLLPDNLWNVAIDELKICEVFNNLIINCKQAMPDGGEIIISGENINIKKRNPNKLKPGEYVHISVRDNGTGIPEEMQTKVFNPFFTIKIKQSGLGLSISYSIILNHKGYINFKSKERHGTTFHIYLRSSF